MQELVTQFQNLVDEGLQGFRVCLEDLKFVFSWNSTCHCLYAESKERIVAHLANFAYDPINYNDFRKVIHSLLLRHLHPGIDRVWKCQGVLLHSLLTQTLCVRSLEVQLHVVDLFMDCLTEPNERLIQFGMEGLCNCCPGA